MGDIYELVSFITEPQLCQARVQQTPTTPVVLNNADDTDNADECGQR